MTQAHKSHPISIERNPNRVRVHFNGRVVADSRSALTLREASLAPVLYIPRADADMALLERTSHRTHCPFKSDANYALTTVARQFPEPGNRVALEIRGCFKANHACLGFARSELAAGIRLQLEAGVEVKHVNGAQAAPQSC